MSSVAYEVLDEALICAHVCHVTAKATAWLFLQEPGFVGFGVVGADVIHWPPGIQVDWSRISDLRLFGELGEWHVWLQWDGIWQSRILKLQDITDALTEYHVLWGTRIQSTATSPWIKLVEDRGAEIWLPLSLEESHLPLRLKIQQIIGYDEKSGLAGIQDASLVALTSNTPNAGERIWTPPHSGNL